jgi:hypothetical protein
MSALQGRHAVGAPAAAPSQRRGAAARAGVPRLPRRSGLGAGQRTWPHPMEQRQLVSHAAAVAAEPGARAGAAGRHPAYEWLRAPGAGRSRLGAPCRSLNGAAAACRRLRCAGNTSCVALAMPTPPRRPPLPSCPPATRNPHTTPVPVPTALDALAPAPQPAQPINWFQQW